MKKTLLFLVLLSTICIMNGKSVYAQYKLEETFGGATFPPAGWNVGPNITLTDEGPVIRRSDASAYTIGNGSAFVFFYDWASGTDSLTTPVFTPTGTSDTLYFDHAYRTYTGGEVDELSVRYSLDGGVTYTELIFLPGGPTVGTGMVTAAPSSSNFSAPTAGQWASKKYVLPAGVNRIQFMPTTAFGNNLFLDNIKVGAPPSIDAGIISTNTAANLFVKGTSYTGMSTVQNNGVLPATFTVTRTITPGGYTDTQPVVGLGGGASQNVSFAPFTYTDGVTYTVRDSIFLLGDTNPANDTLSGVTTLKTAKTTVVLRIHQASVDSITSHLNQLGLAGTYDTLSWSAAQSLDAWSTVVAPFASASFWSGAFRDAMQNFLATAPAPGGDFKRTLMIFGNDLGYGADPNSSGFTGVAADSIFYRQYLKSSYIGDNWISSISGAAGKFMGVEPNFSSSLIDSVADPYPDFVTPVNGGTSAFVPLSVVTNDSAAAVIYSGTNYNVFYGTNVYSNYRDAADVGRAGVNVFAAINEWVNGNGGALPVELASFTSVIDNRKVTLNWSTTEETNNAGFDIERKSTVDNVWHKISNVAGAGNSNVVKSYSFTDNNLATGKYNYRLKQVDYNGNFEYFNLANEVNIGVPMKFALSQNYPNPFNPATKINYDLPFDSKVAIKVFDVTGREITSLVNQVQVAGYHTISFNAANLSSGVYFYTITADGGNQSFIKTMKMVLVK